MGRLRFHPYGMLVPLAIHLKCAASSGSSHTGPRSDAGSGDRSMAPEPASDPGARLALARPPEAAWPCTPPRFVAPSGHQDNGGDPETASATDATTQDAPTCPAQEPCPSTGRFINTAVRCRRLPRLSRPQTEKSGDCPELDWIGKCLAPGSVIRTDSQ